VTLVRGQIQIQDTDTIAAHVRTSLMANEIENKLTFDFTFIRLFARWLVGKTL